MLLLCPQSYPGALLKRLALRPSPEDTGTGPEGAGLEDISWVSPHQDSWSYSSLQGQVPDLLSHTTPLPSSWRKFFPHPVHCLPEECSFPHWPRGSHAVRCGEWQRRPFQGHPAGGSQRAVTHLHSSEFALGNTRALLWAIFINK